MLTLLIPVLVPVALVVLIAAATWWPTDRPAQRLERLLRAWRRP